MADDKHKTVIIRKKRHGGHHGGAWKVAYADFVTAMMAFFLLMWLVGATSEKQRKGIADYFASRIPISPVSGGGDGVLEGGFVPRERDAAFELGREYTDKMAFEARERRKGRPGDGPARESVPSAGGSEVRRMKERRLKEVRASILRRMGATPELRRLAASLAFEETPEGLRLQIFDRDDAPMFPSGSAEPHPRLVTMLGVVADALGAMPNGVTIVGHTDAAPYAGPAASYGNWELSADRANAARRLLTVRAVAPERFRRIEGVADRQPLIADVPLDARNRRIAITLLRDAETTGVGQRIVNDPGIPSGHGLASADTAGGVEGDYSDR